MTKERMIELFEDDRDWAADRATRKRLAETCLVTKRPDLIIFLMLDKLVPGTADIVSAAEHDEIFIDVHPDDLAKAATEEDIVNLRSLGLLYNKSYDCFYMFA